MKRKSFLDRKHKDEQMALQITSMADVFVIILVFLLKSYSVDGLPYEPTLALNPPAAEGRLETRDSLKLELSRDRLALGGKPIGEMKAFRFTAKDLDSDGVSRMLSKALSRSRAGAKPEDGNRLIVVADEGAPYETIKTVLSSAASEGYVDIQLAVSHAN